MQVTIDLPDEIAAELQGEWADVPRRSLEAVAIEAYRSGALRKTQVRELLALDSSADVRKLLRASGVSRARRAADEGPAGGRRAALGLAVGALAIGAAAIGALVIGRLAVRRLAIDRADIATLRIGDLTVDRLTTSRVATGDAPPPSRP